MLTFGQCGHAKTTLPENVSYSDDTQQQRIIVFASTEN